MAQLALAAAVNQDVSIVDDTWILTDCYQFDHGKYKGSRSY